MNTNMPVGDWTQRVNKLIGSSIQEQLQSIARDVKSACESSETTVEKVRDGLDSLVGQLVERANDDFMRLGELIFSVSATLAEVRDEVKALRAALDERIGALESRFESLESRVLALETPAAPARAIPLRMDRADHQRAASAL